MDGEQCNGRPFFDGRGQVREMKAQDLGAPPRSPRCLASAGRASIGAGNGVFASRNTCKDCIRRRGRFSLFSFIAAGRETLRGIHLSAMWRPEVAEWPEAALARMAGPALPDRLLSHGSECSLSIVVDVLLEWREPRLPLRARRTRKKRVLQSKGPSSRVLSTDLASFGNAQLC